jgi:preprotein translocase subunit SecA
MERLKWPDDEPITAKLVTKAVENAQKQIEELNYERRKNVLKYDEVMNGQREVIYAERRKILEGEDLKEQVLGFVQQVVEDTVESYCPPDVFPEEWDRKQMLTALGEIYPVRSSLTDFEEIEDVPALQSRFVEEALTAYEEKEADLGSEMMRELERVVLMNITDTKWREHLYEMDYLQEGIHLRAYAQKDPLTEYRREAFAMFDELTDSIQQDFVRYIYRVQLVRPEQQQRLQRVQENKDAVESGAGGAGNGTEDDGGQAGNPQQAISDKVPRNAPCPCGSGRKYKKCHGAAA